MKDNIINISDIIILINKELNYAQNNVLGDPKIELTNVSLCLNTKSYTDKKGKVQVGLLPINLQYKNEIQPYVNKKVKIELEPPEPTVFKSTKNKSETFELGEFIVDTRKQIQSGLRQASSLTLKELEFEVIFGVVQNKIKSGNIKLYVFSTNGEFKVSDQNYHSIKLLFKCDFLP
jgi:hypothetical protein